MGKAELEKAAAPAASAGKPAEGERSAPGAAAASPAACPGKAGKARLPGPLDIVEAPMEVGELDLSAWLPPPPAVGVAVSGAPQPSGGGGGAETLAVLAIEVWRLKGRLGRLRELVAAKELRPVESAVGKMEEVLQAATVEIDDPQGRPFHEGEPFEVLLFEPSPGLSRPTVVQTVKPLVRVGGRLARRAEVVVGTPVEAAGGAVPESGPEQAASGARAEQAKGEEPEAEGAAVKKEGGAR